MRQKLARASLILLVAVLSLSPVFVASPRAQTPSGTGEVCLAPGSLTVCPPSPVVITGQVGNQVSVAVNLVNSTAFNSFDILVKADPTIINATGFDLSGSVLSSPTVSRACLNGKFIGGSLKGCVPQDGPGVAHLAAAAGCAGVTDGCAWIGSGHLFNITYKVLANTTGIPVVFQSGCSGGSSGSFCVVIEWVTAIILCCPIEPEILQTATFVTGPGGGTGIPVQETLIFGQLTATITGTIVLNSSARTLSGSLSVTVVNSTSGQTIFSKVFAISMTFGSNHEFRFVLAIPMTPLPLGVICTVSSSTSQISCFLVRDPDMANAGVVSILDVVFVFADFGAVRGLPAYRPAADLDADGIVDLLDASIASMTFNAPVFS